MNTRFLLALSALLLACSDDPDPGPAGEPAGAGQSGSSGQAGAGPGGAAGQGGAGAAGSSGGSGQAGAPACDGHRADGVAVAPGDGLHYPPYAVDGCQLLYLAPVAGGAELRLRDLVDGSEQTLAPASERPARPSLAGPVAAWEATAEGRQVVRVRSGGETRTVTGAFAQATEPRATADAVVLTTWQGLDPDSDTDIALFSVATGALSPVFTGPAQQRFADVSPTHVAFSDFAEDPDGAYGSYEDLSDIVLVERASGLLTPHPLSGKQAFPQLGAADAVVYLDWPVDHPEPKYQQYGVSVWTLSLGTDRSLGEVQSLAADHPRPDARGGRVQWPVYPGSGGSKLLRAVLADGTPGQVVGGLEGKTVFAPVSTGSFSLIAQRPDGSTDAPTLSVLAE